MIISRYVIALTNLLQLWFCFGIHGYIDYNTFVFHCGCNVILMISPSKKRKYVDALKPLPVSGKRLYSTFLGAFLCLFPRFPVNMRSCANILF